MMPPMIHPLSDVQTEAIGDRTRIWQYCVVLSGAKIGADCNICSHCFIENDVVVGDRVTVKCGVQLWDGITIEDDVFIGPNVTFTNDPFPRSREQPDQFSRSIVMSGASIGANATILPGLTIGRGAMVGAGSVVTSDVPPGTVVVGCPARVLKYVGINGPTRGSESGAPASMSKIPGVKEISLTTASDIRGHLTVAQWNQHLPFEPKRVFFVHHVPSVRVRGEHAHKECQQILVSLSGSVNVVVDNAEVREEYILDDCSRGLFIPAGIWASQYRYSSDAVMGVFASHDYDEADYIRDYEAYVKYKKNDSIS